MFLWIQYIFLLFNTIQFISSGVNWSSNPSFTHISKRAIITHLKDAKTVIAHEVGSTNYDVSFQLMDGMVKVGGLIQIPTSYTSDTQWYVNVEVLKGVNDEKFVVCWVSTNHPSGSGEDIFCRVFGFDGVNFTNDILINSKITSGDQGNRPGICALPNGGFFVAYQTIWSDVYVNYVDSSFNLIEQLYTPGTGVLSADIVCYGDGTAFFSWSNNDKLDGIKIEWNGTQIIELSSIINIYPGFSNYQSTTLLPDDTIVVSFQMNNYGGDPDFGQYFVLIDSGLTVLPTIYHVNSYTLDDQIYAKVRSVILDNGEDGFVITWTDWGDQHGCLAGSGFGQFFYANGSKYDTFNGYTNEFAVNDCGERYPDVARIGEGKYLWVYDSSAWVGYSIQTLCSSHWKSDCSPECANYWNGSDCETCDPLYEQTNCLWCLNNNTEPSGGCLSCKPLYKNPPNCNNCSDLFTNYPNCDMCLDDRKNYVGGCTTCLPKYTNPSCDQCSNTHQNITEDCFSCLDRFRNNPDCDACADWRHDYDQDCGVCIDGFTDYPDCVCLNSRHEISLNCTNCTSKFSGYSDCQKCSNDHFYPPKCEWCRAPYANVSNDCQQCYETFKPESYPECDECLSPLHTGYMCAYCLNVYMQTYPNCDWCSVGGMDISTNCNSCNPGIKNETYPDCDECVNDKQRQSGEYCDECLNYNYKMPSCTECKQENQDKDQNCGVCLPKYKNWPSCFTCVIENADWENNCDCYDGFTLVRGECKEGGANTGLVVFGVAAGSIFAVVMIVVVVVTIFFFVNKHYKKARIVKENVIVENVNLLETDKMTKKETVEKKEVQTVKTDEKKEVQTVKIAVEKKE